MRSSFTSEGGKKHVFEGTWVVGVVVKVGHDERERVEDGRPGRS